MPGANNQFVFSCVLTDPRRVTVIFRVRVRLWLFSGLRVGIEMTRVRFRVGVLCLGLGLGYCLP